MMILLVRVYIWTPYTRRHGWTSKYTDLINFIYYIKNCKLIYAQVAVIYASYQILLIDIRCTVNCEINEQLDITKLVSVSRNWFWGNYNFSDYVKYDARDPYVKILYMYEIGQLVPITVHMTWITCMKLL
jgi:hypothetical protein